MNVEPLASPTSWIRADVRVVQRGSVASFAQKPCARRLVVGRSRQQFERDPATERRVVRKEHRTHAAATQPPLNPIAPQLDSRCESAVHVHWGRLTTSGRSMCVDSTP